MQYSTLVCDTTSRAVNRKANTVLPTQPATETMKMTDAKQQFSRVVNNVFRTHTRVLVEKGGIPVAAIVGQVLKGL